MLINTIDKLDMVVVVARRGFDFASNKDLVSFDCRVAGRDCHTDFDIAAAGFVLHALQLVASAV